MSKVATEQAQRPRAGAKGLQPHALVCAALIVALLMVLFRIASIL